MIKGIAVTLYEPVQTGENELGEPIYTGSPVEVKNVLVTPLSNEEIVTDLQLHGKRGVYELCIPKGDTHNWRDATVAFFGQTFRTYGPGMEYIEANVPLKWNKKVRVEHIE